MSQLHQLYRLQQIDLALQENQKKLVAVLQAQKEPADMVALRAQLATLQGRGQHGRVQQKDLELQLGSLQSKLAQDEERLYSGKVRNPKELTDLQESVQGQKRQVGVLEESLWGVMMQLEALEEETTAVAQTLASREASRATELQTLKQEQMSVATQINSLNEQRAAQLKLIQSDKLADYEQIRRKKGGEAVSRISQNMCERCRTSLPEMIIRAVNMGEYRFCPSCNRILAPMG
jgi:uncharacterized protein